jgi:hypothetical protein
MCPLAQGFKRVYLVIPERDVLIITKNLHLREMDWFGNWRLAERLYDEVHRVD